MGGCFSTLCKNEKNHINTEETQDTTEQESESHSRERLLNVNVSSPPSPPIDDTESDKNNNNDNKNNNNDISKNAINANPTDVEMVDGLRYYGAVKYRDDEEVRVRIETCSTWLESHIVDYCGEHKYRVRIHRSPEFSRFIKGKYLRIVDEDDIRHNSRIPEPLTSNSEIKEDIMDLYMNGRKCLPQLNELTQSIHHNYNNVWLTTYRQRRVHGIEYIQARFVAMEIMNYCFDEEYHWRLYCFWCKDLNAKMYRATCRHHVIGSGATSVGYYGQQLSLMAFCDKCNTELNYEDYSYRCINKQHDICINCVWEKVLKYGRIKTIVKPILMDKIGMDRYSCQCVIEYMVGNVRKFDGASHDINDAI